MNKLIRLSVLTLIATFIVACQSEKEAAYSKLKDLYADVEANAEQYNAQDWEQFLNEFHRVDSLTSINEYTPEIQKEIDRLKVGCSVYAVRARVEVAGKEIKDVIQEAAGAFEGVMEGLGLKNKKN